MKRIFLYVIVCVALHQGLRAQDGYFFVGEAGIAVGGAHYFGDLNTRAALNKPGISYGVFAKKNFGNFTALRVAANYARVGYADKYNLKNKWQRGRNLSFFSDVYEFSLQGDFNFLKYMPNSEFYRYTPYITFGVGLFAFEPMAYSTVNPDAPAVSLRSIAGGTEGVEYQPMAVCFPLGVGMKFSLTRKLNLMFEAGYRFTTTDYLDDVSTSYLPPDNPSRSKALPQVAEFFDRSEKSDYSKRDGNNNPGLQRGNPSIKDSYIFAHIGLSINIISYKCPTAY